MKKTAIVLVLVFMFSISYAQVRVYEKNETTTTKTTKNKTWSVWKVKIDAYELALVGTGKLYVEKNITNWFAIELGGGITYFSIYNNLLLEATFNSSDNFFGKPKSFTPSSIKDNSYGYSYIEDRSAKIGFALSALPKFYFDSDPLDGFFMGPLIEYKKFKYDMTYKNDIIPYSYNTLNTFLVLGGTKDLSDLICLESMFGVGPSFVNDKRPISYYNQLSGNTELGTANFGSPRLNFLIAFRFAFYFD